LAFGVGTVDIWLFECSQPDFVAFGYDELGISPKIELLASGERIFDLLWWVQLCGCVEYSFLVTKRGEVDKFKVVQA
jgi:hypothetical protein